MGSFCIMKKISERIIIDNGYKQIRQSFYENEKGKQLDFLTIGNADASNDNVVDLVLTPDWQIVLNREYRFWPEKYVIGVPTGIIDTGESITEALIREVSEETGYVPEVIIPLGSYIDNPYSHAINHFFVTRYIDTVLSAHDDGEDISTILVTPLECEKMIFDGRIECCFTPGIYFLAKTKTNNFTNF